MLAFAHDSTGAHSYGEIDYSISRAGIYNFQAYCYLEAILSKGEPVP
jgi:hypothetical protein